VSAGEQIFLAIGGLFVVTAVWKFMGFLWSGSIPDHSGTAENSSAGGYDGGGHH
jgi:hypothetical protein